jgi:hypothetical protein
MDSSGVETPQGGIQTSDYTPVALPEDIVYDEIIEEDVVLGESEAIFGKKIWYKGNVTVRNNVSIRDGIVRIDGDFIIEDGSFHLAYMTFMVEGDLRLQTLLEDDVYGEGTGSLGIRSSSLVVKGDFYNQSAAGYWPFGEDAVLELHGNLTNLSKAGFNSTHPRLYGKVVFAGEEEQHLFVEEVETRKARVGKIQVANAAGKLFLDSSIP